MRDDAVSLATMRHALELGVSRARSFRSSEAAKIGERLHGIDVVASAAHIAVHPVGVRPVGLHRNRSEVSLGDKPLCDLGALAIELVGAVGGFTQQCEACFADSSDERIVVTRGSANGKKVARKALMSASSVAGSCAASLFFGSFTRASSSRISSSVLCEKSWYQRPTA